jgi:hypothetical protein
MTGNGVIWGRSRTSRYVHAYPSPQEKSFCGRKEAAGKGISMLNRCPKPGLRKRCKAERDANFKREK